LSGDLFFMRKKLALLYRTDDGDRYRNASL